MNTQLLCASLLLLRVATYSVHAATFGLTVKTMLGGQRTKNSNTTKGVSTTEILFAAQAPTWYMYMYIQYVMMRCEFNITATCAISSAVRCT